MQPNSRADAAAADRGGERPSGERGPAGLLAGTHHRDHCCPTGEAVPQGETPEIKMSFPVPTVRPTDSLLMCP